MKQLLINTALKFLGGWEGIIEMALTWFNEKVLAKIKDPEEFAAYAADVTAFAEFLDGVFNRHQKWMSEGRRAALTATINAVRELAKALADCNVTKEEVDAIIDQIVAAIEAWKKAS